MTIKILSKPRLPFSPRPYQKIIIDHMLEHTHCSIWAGMGMGKTVSVLTAFDALYLASEEIRPSLVLAPLRVANSTWPDESGKWGHLRNIEIQPIIGTAEQRLAALQNTNASVFTINYENLVWLTETLGKKWPFGAVVSDESTRLKGFRLRGGGKRAGALARIVKANKPTRWVNLTGTPAPNGLIDLWGQQWFVDRGQRLGRTFGAFKDRWFDTFSIGDTGYSEVQPRPYAQEQIQDALRDICISLNAADYFDIAQPITVPVYVDLPAKTMKQYREMEKELYLQIEHHEIEAMNAASKTMKCLQLASGAIYTDDKGNWISIHDAKLQALDSIINEAAGMPVLVAYHFKSDLARLKKAFPQGRQLDSDPQTIADWNNGKIPVLFAHPASAGHGLNLQDGGNILVFFSHWWDLEQFQQITERIGPTRQAQAGHDRPVFIYFIIARGTADELVMIRRDTKRSVQDILLEAVNRKRGN